MAFGPWGGAAIEAGGNLLGGLYGGGGEQESKGSIVSPMQRLLQYTMMRNALTGNLGDMGGGTAFKQGQANFAQQAADRGISADSGAYQSGLANIAQQSQALDTNNLRDYMLNIAGMQQQVGPAAWGATQGIPTGALGAQYGAQGGPTAAAGGQQGVVDLMRRRMSGNSWQNT